MGSGSMLSVTQLEIKEQDDELLNNTCAEIPDTWLIQTKRYQHSGYAASPSHQSVPVCTELWLPWG